MANWLSDSPAGTCSRGERAGNRQARARFFARAARRWASFAGGDAAHPSPRGLLDHARRLPENGRIENTPRAPVGTKIAPCPREAPAPRPLAGNLAVLSAVLLALALGAVSLSPGRAAAQRRDEYIIEHTLKLPRGTVYAAFYTPDQKAMVTLGRNFAIRFWEIETARVTKDIRTGKHQAVSVVHHPKEQVLFTGGKDRSVRVWDIAKGTSSVTFEGHGATVGVLLTDTEGKILFSGADDGKVIIWDVEAAKAIGTLTAHRGKVTALALHPDGKHLATGGSDRTIKVWNWRMGKVLRELSGHLGAINQLRFGPNPEVLASASADGTIKFWQWNEPDKPDFATLVGHKRAVTGLVFHPNEKWLISASLDETIKIWSVESRKILQELTLVEGSIGSLSLSANGRRVFAGYQKDRARTWRLEKSAFLASLQGHSQSVKDLDFTKDSQFLISASQDKTVKIWNLRTLATVRSYPTENHQVQAVRFSPDDRQFATGGADGFVIIWDTASGKTVRRLRGHSGKVNAIAFHPKERILVSAGSDKTWVIWETDTGRPVKRVASHEAQVTAVEFSRDGNSFATGSDDKTVRVWSYPGGELKQTMKGHTGGIEKVRFDPKGRYVASASEDGTVKVWDLKKGTLRFDFKGHDFIVSDLGFAPDGRALVTVSRDKTVKLWDLQTGKFLRTVSGEKDQILALALAPDGSRMATGSIGPNINLMVYPLKVLLAEEKEDLPRRRRRPRAPQPEQAEAPPPAAGAPPDLSALTAAPDEGARALAYKEVKEDDSATRLRKMETDLNTFMKAGQFCKNAKAVDDLAHRILALAPYDKAAYHALVNTAVVTQDLKMIYLMSKLGQRALFLGSIYSYDFPQSVDAKLDFWQHTVFNSARERAGRKLELEFIGCSGEKRVRSTPTELLMMDLPVEALRIIASRRVRADFRQFKNLDAETFKSRVFHLIDQAMAAHGAAPDGEPVVLELKAAKPRPAGIMELDLSRVDLVGDPEAMIFKLRRARHSWQTFSTDRDRRKNLLLPVGNYYLMLNRKVAKAFSIRSGQSQLVVVEKLRR